VAAVARAAGTDEQGTAAPEVHFEGTPTALTAVIDLPPAQRKAIMVEVQLPDVDSAQPVRTLTAPAADVRTQVRLVLASGTPPGSYQGTVHTPLGDLPAVIIVQNRPHLILTPSMLRMSTGPGGEVTQRLTVANAGNVRCTIGSTYAFGLFETDGLDRAVGAGLLSDTGGLDRVATIVDSLADSHGGLVRVSVREGAGALDPGEARELVAVLRFSDRLRPGHQYFSNWRLQDVCAPVLVDVARSRSKTTESRVGESG
jgi:hypothetical protein